MATMNKTKKPTPVKKDTNTMTSPVGEVVHKLDALEKLYNMTIGSFMGEQKKNVEDSFVDLVKTINAIPYEDREYALKVAYLGREKNMISFPLAILTACFNDERFKGEDFLDERGRNKLQKYAKLIVRRGRDITDIMSMQINAFGFDVKNHKRDLPLPIQLRKSLKGRLESFNEFQLSKALGESKEVSLADCIKLLRPNELQARVRKGFYKEVIEGRVKFADGKETVQSTLANSRNTNSETSVQDIKKSLGNSTLFAIVKNLEAFAGMPNNPLKDQEFLREILNRLYNSEEVRKSKMLPMRFYSAYRVVSTSRYMSSGIKEKLLDALSIALDSSIDNLESIEGYSAILIDVSGSTKRPVSQLSTVTIQDMGMLLGAIAFKKGVGDVYLFATNPFYVEGMSRSKSIISILSDIDKARCTQANVLGGSTYLNKALSNVEQVSRDFKIQYDNVLVFSDSDCYQQPRKGEYLLHGTFDQIISVQLNNHLYKRFYLNDLLGNEFSLVNTNDPRKQLITGYSETFIDTINYNIRMQSMSDIRELIDYQLENLQTKRK